MWNLLWGGELNGKKIRLIIYNNGKELVCRKSALKEITQFLKGTDDKLFKGRLQLLKNEDNIVIKVKNDIAGIITRQALMEYLANVIKYSLCCR